MKLMNKIKLLVIFALTLIASLCFVACDGNGGSADVTIPDVEATLPEEINTYTDTHDNTVVTLDGTITDEEWSSQNKMDVVVPVASYDHRVEVWSRFTEDGVLMAYRVTGAPAYFVESRDKTNSGLEVYVANGNATAPNGNQWEIDVFASGFYKTACWLERNGKSGYAYANTYMDVAGRWLDKNGETTYVNNPENNGYEDEVFIPWTIFGGKCDSIVFNAAILYMSSAHETTRGGWVSLTEALEGDAFWLNCQQWRRFDKNGYYDKFSSEWGITPYDIGYTPYNDGLAITGFDWNLKPGFQKNKNVFTADKFVTSVKLYAPHLAHEEGSEMWNKLLAKETDTNTKDNGGTETATAGIRIDNNENYIEVAIQKDYANGFKFRWNGSKWGWSQIKLSDKQVEKYMTVGLKVGLYVDGNTVIPLIENDDGSLERAGSNMTKVIEERDASKPNTVRIYYQCDVKFDEYNVYTGDNIKNMFTVKDETSEDENGSVTVSGAIFGDLVVNVTPDDGYELKKLTVNGADYTGEVVNNVLTIRNFEYNTATVKAIFREEITQSITLNVTQKFPYETTAYSADGVVITLTDAAGESYSGKIANGAVTIKILDGTYTLTADSKYSTSVAVVVEGGVASVTDVILIRKIVKSYGDSVTVVENETGAKITTTAGANVALSDVDMTDALLIADLYGLAPNWADIGIEPYTWTALKEANSRLNGKTDTEGTGYRIDWKNYIADGTFTYQMGGGKHGNFYARTDSEYLTVALKTTAVDDTTSRTDIYVKNSFGTWYYHGYMVSAVASHSELYYKFIFNGANNVKNVMLYDGARATAYFATLTMYVETETNSVTKDGVTLTRKNSQVDLSKFESEGTILSTGSYESQVDFTASENVVAMTFNIQIIDKTWTGKYDGNGIILENDQWKGPEILHSNNGYINCRFRTPTWAGFRFTETELSSLYEEGGIGMAYVIKNGTEYLLLKGADGKYTQKLVNNVEATKITLIKFRTAAKFTDVKVYTASAYAAAPIEWTQA